MELFDNHISETPYINCDKLISQLGVSRAEKLIALMEKLTKQALLEGHVTPIYNVGKNHDLTDYILLNKTGRHKIATGFHGSEEAVAFCAGEKYLRQQKIIEVTRSKILQRKNRHLEKKGLPPISPMDTVMQADGFLPFFEMDVEQAIEFLKVGLDTASNMMNTTTHKFYIDTVTNQLMSMSNETYTKAYEASNSSNPRLSRDSRQPKSSERPKAGLSLTGFTTQS